MAKAHIVAVYLVDLAYGGPEEGGWWYDRGELARQVRMFRNEETANIYCRRLNARLHSRELGPNKGRREKSSVLSDGVYQATVCEDHCPTYYPQQRPHFE